MPGVREFLLHCADSAHTLAVASANDAWWVERHLDRLGIRSSFAAVVCAGGPLRPKPYPDVYLRALAQTGADPVEAVAVEDSFAGLWSAFRAGVPAVWASGADVVPPPDLHVVRRVRTLAELIDVSACGTAVAAGDPRSAQERHSPVVQCARTDRG
jgi:beta-phosphoglucomutase-like phosphatase (HAD superfamily)